MTADSPQPRRFRAELAIDGSDLERNPRGVAEPLAVPAEGWRALIFSGLTSSATTLHTEEMKTAPERLARITHGRFGEFTRCLSSTPVRCLSMETGSSKFS